MRRLSVCAQAALRRIIVRTAVNKIQLVEPNFLVSNSNLQIKQFELSDLDALLVFLQGAYPDEPRKCDPAYWRWHFLENPYTEPHDVPLWILKDGRRVVGQVATILVELKVGAEVTRAIWILDFIVHQDYRGQGLGKRLMLAAREAYPTQFALGFNEQSEAVLRSLKWAALGGVGRYQRLLFPGNALREVAQYELLRRSVNFAYAPFRPRLDSSSAGANWELREVSKFDDSFDALWQRARQQWICVVERHARYLAWQFARQPGKRFDVLGLYEQERLLGYVVVFVRKAVHSDAPPKASIADLCYDAKNSIEIIDELLRAALRLALERRAGSLVFDVLDERVEERLQRFGFWQIKRAPQFMASPSEYQNLMFAPGNWFLTRGDSDVSIFEEANLEFI